MQTSHARPSVVSLDTIAVPSRIGERAASVLYALSFVAITGTVAIASVRMWRDARRAVPELVSVAAAASAPGATPRAILAPDCAGPTVQVEGASLVQCPGWLSIVDARDGSMSVEPGAAALAQWAPPLLLRSDGTLAAWLPAQRRFDAGRRLLGDTLAVSAVVRRGRLITRESRGSNTLAYACNLADARCTAIHSNLEYTDDEPLIRDCGAGVPPRYQLVELSPRIGEAFDPQVARQRVFGLIDSERGTLAWTSDAVEPVRPAQRSCTGGMYVVDVELAGGERRVWTIDAETGERR